MSKCFDIPQSKPLSAVRHGVVVKRPWARCMVTGEDTLSDEMAGERPTRETKRIGGRFLETETNNTGRVENGT